MTAPKPQGPPTSATQPQDGMQADLAENSDTRPESTEPAQSVESIEKEKKKMATLTKPRRRGKPGLDLGQRGQIRRWLDKELGIRIDFAHLSDDEAVELHQLCGKAESTTGMLALAQLSREENLRFEELAEKGTGNEPGTIERGRAAAAMRSKFDELKAYGKRRDQMSQRQQHDLLAIWGEMLAARVINAEALGVLVVVMSALASGKSLGHKVEIVGSGRDAKLRFDRGWGLVGGYAQLRWERHLKFLVASRWLDQSSAGPMIEVSPGPMWLAAVEKSSTAMKELRKNLAQAEKIRALTPRKAA